MSAAGRVCHYVENPPTVTREKQIAWQQMQEAKKLGDVQSVILAEQMDSEPSTPPRLPVRRIRETQGFKSETSSVEMLNTAWVCGHNVGNLIRQWEHSPQSSSGRLFESCDSWDAPSHG